MNMKMKNLFLVGSLFAATVTFAGVSAFAEGDSLTEKISKLKQDFRAKEQQMENEKDISKKIALGEEMKKKGIEIGDLQRDVALNDLEDRIKGAEVDVAMQEQYLNANGKYKHLNEKLKPARDIINKIKENKEGKTAEQRSKELDKVYEILKSTMDEVNQGGQTAP
ncbi:hypothetical protein OS242_09550 [Tumebacillus sp. DT12]|uniref:Uncharacterized protein n=1 Tax=Tumebacillus lacus TaxID=2995335 RepID=A0ABT3X3P3_9BACL|nr:hypothetical protein [Tumebacillus lacus]MCX7570205.1 hypothetical protein [Tumebacillus lacus]